MRARLEKNGHLLIDCPGCGMLHAPNVRGDHSPKWGWNGSLEFPTITPSLLVRWPAGNVQHICHSFITEGKIQFLSDCTHDSAGKTLDLLEVK